MKRNVVIAIVAIVVAGIIAHVVHMFAAGHGTHGTRQDDTSVGIHANLSKVPR